MSSARSFGPDGRYAVVEQLGQGGMGTLFVAEDRVLRRRVALKLLREELRERPEALARFLREARILARLEHPNLVRVFEVELEPPSFLVMELLEGEDLERRLAGGRLLAPPEARRLAAEMAEALAYLHGRQVLHRDLKPANVFLGSDGRSRLLDFGLSLPVDLTRLTLSGQLLGTPLFLPPEVARGGDYGTASDVYQAGLVLHLALAGRLPFEGADDPVGLIGRLTSGAPRPVSVDPLLPVDLASLVASCVAPDPAARPADGAALVGAVARAHSALTTTSNVPAPAPAPRPAASRPSLAPPAAVALLLALLVAGALTLRPEGGSGPAREVPDVAREYALLPDGLAVGLLSSAARAPECEVLVDGASPRRVPFAATADGWAATPDGLPAGARGTLTVLDGSRPLARSRFALPATTLAGPATARFGLDAVEVSWALHGRARVDVVVEVPRTGQVLCRRSLRAPCTVRVPVLGRNEPVRWRLERGGGTLAAGAGLVGVGRRHVGRLGLPDADSDDRRELQPALVGSRVVMLQDARNLAAMAPTLSVSGTGFSTAALAVPVDVASLSGSHAFITVAPDGPGGVVVLAASSTSARLLRLPVPWKARPRPEWTLDLPDSRRRPSSCRLADGRLLLASEARGRVEGGWNSLGGVFEVVDTSTGTLRATMRTPPARVMAAAPLGDGALVVARVDGRSRVFRVTGGAAPALDGWSFELPGTVALVGEDNLPCAACPAGPDGSALLVFGAVAHLVTPGPTPVVRSVALPVPPGGFVAAVGAGGDGVFLAAGISELMKGSVLPDLSAHGGRLHLVRLVRGPDGSLEAAPAGEPRVVFRDPGRSYDTGLLCHGGRVYVTVGMQLLAFRESPGHEFVGDWLVPENAFSAPFVASGCVLVACRGATLVGFDLVGAPDR